jgi:hypothetical protein
MKVGDLVVHKGNGWKCGDGAGIVTWVEDTDSVTYQVDVDWGELSTRTVSYLLEVMR